jgi:tetratricopeptide (TPR) repeat protein
MTEAIPPADSNVSTVHGQGDTPADPFWERVRVVFQAAIELPAHERDAFVARECDGADDVRAEVESLLASHDQSADFIEPPPRENVTFIPGSVVADRYRVVRLLGRGGMGEVFEAEDRELHELVALKLILPRIASNPRMLQRFRREIQLARRVTHPNVCRIYDVSHHVSHVKGQERRTSFVSMELLHGRTLAEQLRANGAMTTTEALPIARQMSAGLAAAHAASIVHRDFKSANVMLVSSAPRDASVRAVITDFGLAQQTDGDKKSATPLTDTGVLIGTPDYMAPEQLQDGPLSPATDIYALGVVLFEMVTGRLPFSGTTPLNVAVSRLNQPAPSPRMWNKELDARWEAVILRCLERDPSQRYQDATEVAAALDAGSPMPQPVRRAATTMLSGETVRRRPKALSIAAIAAGVIAVALPFVMHEREKAATVPAPAVAAPAAAAVAEPVKPRRTVAVLGVRNLAQQNESEWLSGAFAEMLSSEIAAGEKLRAVPRDDIERMKLDLGWKSENESTSTDALQKVRARFGTDVVLVGSYLALGASHGGKVRLDVNVEDATSGDTLGTISESGTEGELIELVSRVGGKLRSELGAAALNAADEAGLRASRSSDPLASRYYFEGLTRVRRLEPVAARTLFEKAIARDPKFAMAHAALADALWAIGYEAASVTEIEAALRLSGNLAREERLVIEARNAVMHKQWDKSVEIYSSLFTVYPDELSYGVRAGLSQIAAGKAKDALAMVARMRALPEPARSDPAIDLVEAEAAHSVHDPNRELDAARRAGAKAKQAGMRTVLARARSNEAFALRDLGRLDESLAASQDSVNIFAAVGDEAGSARALSNMANTLWTHGDLRAAKAAFEKSLVVHRRIGSPTFEARTLHNLGNVEFGMGDSDAAEKSWRRALELEKQTNFRTLMGNTLSNIGSLEQVRGHLDAAAGWYEQAIEVSRSTDDEQGAMTAIANIAELLRNKGDVVQSRQRYVEALALAQKLKNVQNETYIRASMGELSLMEAKLAESRKEHEQSLSMRKSSGEKIGVAQSTVLLASVAIEEGKAAAAEPTLRDAAAVFHAEKASEDEALAYETMARTQLAQGNVAGARTSIATARQLAQGSKTVSLLAAIATTEARVLTAAGNYAAGATKAREAIDIAHRSQMGVAELDARLAAAQNERKRGNTSEATRQIAEVRQQAANRGLMLIARKAV